MGYRELLEALEAEVGRRIRELDEEAGRESRRLLEETRPQLAAERAAALAREGRRLDEEASRAVGRARVERERTLLAEQWRLMAELRREAEARLSALSNDDVDAALGRLPCPIDVRHLVHYQSAGVMGTLHEITRIPQGE